MGTVLSWFLIVLGAATLIALILVIMALISYRGLTVTLKPVSAFPEFKFKLASLVGSAVSFIARNFILAAGGFISGVKLNGRIIIHNHSLMPLYLPAIEHEVSISGKSCLNTLCTRALWLRPGANVTLPVTLTVGTGDIPDVAMAGLTHGGAIAIIIDSKVTLGSFSLLKTTRVTVKSPKALPKPATAPSKPLLKTDSRGRERAKTSSRS
jgi:hypothetical protein